MEKKTDGAKIIEAINAALENGMTEEKVRQKVEFAISHHRSKESNKEVQYPLS